MATQTPGKNRLVLALIAVGCVLVDAGILVALGNAVIWLVGMASPYVWAGVVLAGIVAARVVSLLRQVRYAHRPAAERC